MFSALTSVLGFTVMALAPTPIFATFGTLIAVMIGLSLVATLVVLPSLLVLVTPAKVEARETLPRVDEAWCWTTHSRLRVASDATAPRRAYLGGVRRRVDGGERHHVGG